MRFHLGDVEVFFPYDRIYPEQYQYMSRLKEALDVGAGGGAQRRHCLLEMPTGTGKTVSLLSLITSYQATHKLKVGKLIYCTRTVPEMTHAISSNTSCNRFAATNSSTTPDRFALPWIINIPVSSTLRVLKLSSQSKIGMR